MIERTARQIKGARGDGCRSRSDSGRLKWPTLSAAAQLAGRRLALASPLQRLRHARRPAVRVPSRVVRSSLNPRGRSSRHPLAHVRRMKALLLRRGARGRNWGHVPNSLEFGTCPEFRVAHRHACRVSFPHRSRIAKTWRNWGHIPISAENWHVSPISGAGLDWGAGRLYYPTISGAFSA